MHGRLVGIEGDGALEGFTRVVDLSEVLVAFTERVQDRYIWWAYFFRTREVGHGARIIVFEVRR